MFWKVLKTEFARAFHPAKMAKSIGILAVLMFCSVGFSSAFEYILKYGDGSILDQINHFMGFDVFKCVMTVVLASLYTDSFSRDDNSRYLRMVFYRTDVTTYTQCRFLANLCVVVVTSIAAFYAYTLVSLCFIPIVRGGSDPVVESFYGQFYYREMVMQAPFLYVGYVGFVFGLVSAACSSFGLLYSAYKPNAFVSIGLAGLVLFIGLSYTGQYVQYS